ncbi:hypothetical protein [Pseudomonas sp. Z4-20]|uniref:hypothetical protein n=1 Tax=Pseudomonas sp. Z4-20 TaxID=2817414 RepID=UPI003DAA254E
MSEDAVARFTRFHTPNPGLAPREQAPMLAQELAWARERALMHRFSWFVVLVPPLSMGLVLPGLVFLSTLALVQKLFAPDMDIDRIVGDSLGWLALATLLFVAGWALSNYLRDSRDPTHHYWQSMPDHGLVELERHTLVSGLSLWANDFDPDCNSLMLWKNDKLVRVQSSGVSQWVLAMTEAGHWLVLKDEFPGDFCYGRVGQMATPDKQMQPRQQLAIAFAPGTQLALGQRFEGAPLPMTQTSYWMSADEIKRLAEVAHHWVFFPPDRYAVVNARDAGWVQRLVDRALHE